MKDLPQRLRLQVGALPPAGTLPDPYPYETVEPHRDGCVERAGVRTWYAQYGASGPWLVFSPIYQIANSYMLRGVVPWLSQHFRVLVMDLRGNGRSDRPTRPEDYSFDHYYADLLAVLDAAQADKVAIVGISATAMAALRLAAEQPQRVSHVITVGGWVDMRMQDPAMKEAAQQALQAMRANWPGFLDGFFSAAFSEPHSTKQYEDAVLRCGGASDGATVALGREGWLGNDALAYARQVRCPALVIHGDRDRIAPMAQAEAIVAAVPGARLLTIAGGGHLPTGRDPVMFCHALRDFVGAAPARATWTRGMARKPRALFVSSAIGLGHVQRDLAIARELRRQRPDLEVDWFTVHPASAYLEREGERVHPACAKLANESRHFERQAGEHDLQAFFALRTMDEVMARNFLVFSELVRTEHYDIVIGDEAWEVDYHYHEHPELKRQPFVFLTDFVGCLPMEEGNEREAFLCADRNADDLEHVARYPWIRDRAIFVGNEDDLPEVPFGPGLPDIRDWTRRNFAFSGYALPFDPKSLADTDELRARHGYTRAEKLVIASVGGTSVGGALLHRIAETFPLMKRQVPGLRMVLVAGPRLPRDAFPEHEGLDVLPYVHNLFEHLACADLALVQGGLSTCMELVATRRPFLRFPLERHFEQCIHVTQRMRNYCAECTVRFQDLAARDLAERALQAMHAPVNYRPVETDGAERAARQILAVMDNRHWAAA